MRRPIAAVLVLAVLTGPAFGQQSKPRRRLQVIPPAASVATSVGAASPATAAASGAAPNKLASSSSSSEAVQTSSTLSGPDPAPQCRAQCSEQRYFCLSGSDGQCDPRWTRCLDTCRATPPS